MRPHKCNQCEKAFVDKRHLQKHISTIHDGVKYCYKCDLCGKDFSDVTNLRTHIRKKHTVSNELNMDRKPPTLQVTGPRLL